MVSLEARNYKFIGTIYTPFKEKFGVPRQSLLIKEAKGVIRLEDDPHFFQAISQLEKFSHLWLIFDFHKNEKKEWRPLVETPREGTDQKIGVFASRTPYRPNNIGMSVVKLDEIVVRRNKPIEIHVSGVDILDETPILDIKPYLPYTDKVRGANSGWVQDEIKKYKVTFSPHSLKILNNNLENKKLVKKMLELDPRPVAQRKRFPITEDKSEGKKFAFRVFDWDIHWEIRNHSIFVKTLL